MDDEDAASAAAAGRPEPATASGPWSRNSRRVAYENAWITIWHDEVTRPDGAPGVYGVVHFANLAAGVLALDVDDRVLLVGQHRYTLDAYSWEIPEGGSPTARAPSTAHGVNCSKRPASRPANGASWHASTSRTASATSWPCCSSPPS